MSRLVIGLDSTISSWVAERIPGCARGLPEPCVAIGVADSRNSLIFGAVYHDYSPETGVIEMSCAADSPKWATRGNIHYLLEHAFVTTGCQMLVMRVSASNHRTTKLINGLGFKSQTIERLYGRNENGILFTLTDDEWKAGKYYLKGK